ncbi:MAG: ribosome biogenesis GTPase Der [Patescibacteria group bacterium]
MLPKVAIVGRPNTGKSTLFNRILGSRIAITSEVSGTTRDKVYENINWKGTDFQLIDTGGIELLNPQVIEGDLQSLVQNEVWFAINEANIIVFLLDFRTELTKIDFDVAEKLKKSKKPVVLVLNKVDHENDEIILESANFLRLGLGTPFLVSALHGTGISDFLDFLVDTIRQEFEILDKIEVQQNFTRLAILGRPNAGKSTLFNQLSENFKSIVDLTPGTTRDPIWGNFNYKNTPFKIWDTAGVRRRTKVDAGIEYYSVTRALQIAEIVDIIILVLDGSDGKLAHQDLELLHYANRFGKGVLIFVNKWDKIEVQKEKFGKSIKEILTKKLENEFYWTSVIYGSAKTGKNLKKILDKILEIKKEREKVLAPEKLNEWFEEIKTLKYPTRRVGIGSTRIFKIKQKFSNPPCFEILVNKKLYFGEDFEKFIKRRIRQKFGFEGTSIYIDIEETK